MSRISHKYKFIFFAYPKTGSTSIRDTLNTFSDICATTFSKRTPEQPFYSHITAQETKDLFAERGWDFDSYFKFVVVRNPYSRLVSLYNMTDVNKCSFPHWVENINSNTKTDKVLSMGKWKINGLLPLLQFAGNGTNLLVDKVVCLENIDTELPAIFKQLGITVPASIPKLNVGHYRVPVKLNDWHKYYDETTKQRVKKIYKWEIVEYRYIF